MSQIPAYAPSIPDWMRTVSSEYNRFAKQFDQGQSGQFYNELGAFVNKIADRLFVGDAVKHAGTNVISQPDWLTTYEIARGRVAGAIHLSQSAFLNQPGCSNTLVVGAQTATVAGDAYNAIGGWFTAVSNRGVSTSFAYAAYFEAHRYGAGSGGAYGQETDIVNWVGNVQIDPFTQLDTQTIGIQLASGGGLPGTLYSASAAYNIRNNGADFLSGIVFGSDAIKLTGGVGEAIAFATGHKVQWYGAAGTGTSAIYSDGTTAAGGSSLQFGEGFVKIADAGGNLMLKSLHGGALQVSVLSADPATLADGMIWVNGTAGKARARIGGLTVDLN